MKKVLAATAALTMLLTGCMAEGSVNPDDSVNTEGEPSFAPIVREFEIRLKNGRTIPCVWIQKKTGGLSCNWSKA